MDENKNKNGLDQLERKIGETISQTFFDAKIFFSRPKLTSEQREMYLQNLATDFASTYEDHPSVGEVICQKRLLRNYYFVPIRYLNTHFVYPHDFTKYFDLEQDQNLNLKENPSFEELESYLTNYKETSLEIFLTTIVEKRNQAIFKLRRREWAVLNDLTNLEFIQGCRNNGYLWPPLENDLVRLNHFKKRQHQTIKRAVSLLYFNDVVGFSGYKLNPGKLGYSLVCFLGENTSDLPANLGERAMLWRVVFDSCRDTVYCLPNKVIDELELEERCVLFSHQLRSINPSTLGRTTFSVSINDQDQELSSQFLSLPLRPKSTNTFNHQEQTFIRSLREVNFLSPLYTIGYSKMDKASLTSHKRLLNQLTHDQALYLYPDLNHLGLDYWFFLKFQVSELKLLVPFLNILAQLPEVNILVDERSGLGFCYIRLTKMAVGIVLDVLKDLNSLQYPEIMIKFADLTKQSIYRDCITIF